VKKLKENVSSCYLEVERMFCTGKHTGIRYWKHVWVKKVQRYPYLDALQSQVLREVSTCKRCGKEKIVILNLSSGRIKKDLFKEELWEDF
jgi:hypothetical protein